MAKDPEEELVDALTKLAAPANEQKSYLKRIGVFPQLDELALEFSDALQITKPSLSGQLSVVLLDIDRKLDQLSGPTACPSLWRAPSLDRAQEWQEVRDLASQALAMFSAGQDGV